MSKPPTKLLVFSTLFPHDGELTLGVFVENRLRNLLAHENVTATVIAPVPWFPFKSNMFGAYARSARARKVEHRDGLTIYHPRYLVIPKIGMMWTPWFLFRSAWRCYKKLQDSGEKFDIIDAHYLYPDAVAAAKLAKSVNLPFVATARGSDVTQIALMPKPQKCILEAIGEAQHVITVSANLKRDLVSMGGSSENISVLRNGVDLNRFREKKRKQGRARYPAGPIMVFAGWLIPRKRLDLVLGVTRLLPKLNTVIVGDGPLMESCQQDAERMGIASRVFFEGQKQPEEMPNYFSLADVLILPSDREGWANVLLEAMACGTPVVSRAVGGAPDLILDGKIGRVVDGEDPVILAKAIESVLEICVDREAIREYASGYDWSETSMKQAQIFDAAISNYRSGNERA